jgi:hypothetical protein
VCAFAGLGEPATKNLIEKTAKRSHFHCIATLASTVPNTPTSDEVLWRNDPSIRMENIMRRRVMMILASAVLAGSLLATGAQAQGGGDFGRGMGGFGGGHVGGLGVGHVGGLGGDYVDCFGAGRMAHVDQGHLGVEGVISSAAAFTTTASVAHTIRRTAHRTPAPTEW